MSGNVRDPGKEGINSPQQSRPGSVMQEPENNDGAGAVGGRRENNSNLGFLKTE